ncbi:MAG: hypothetical protein ACW98I_16585, partial [Candidatus Hodarchaeales archaeon]
HVQAIIKLKDRKITLDIVEPSDFAQNLTKDRIKEIPHNEDDFSINLHQSISDLPTESDLVIISTTAAGREAILEKLLDVGHRDFIIEKVVCQSKTEYKGLITKFREKNANGWVNTARRYFSTYQALKNLFENEKNLFFSVIAGNRGLGCNAIHYIDLFSWFADSYDLKLNGDFLHDRIYENKRGKDFLEFSGSIVGSLNDGSRFSITFLPFESIPDIVSIVGENHHVLINETYEKIQLLHGTVETPLEYRNEYVSSITTNIVQDIFDTGTCKLPSLEDSSFAHYELFRIFNQHIKKITGEEPKLCPIT